METEYENYNKYNHNSFFSYALFLNLTCKHQKTFGKSYGALVQQLTQHHNFIFRQSLNSGSAQNQIVLALCPRYGRSLSYRNQSNDLQNKSMICRTNQWTGFYMIETSKISGSQYFAKTIHHHNHVFRGSGPWWEGVKGNICRKLINWLMWKNYWRFFHRFQRRL